MMWRRHGGAFQAAGVTHSASQEPIYNPKDNHFLFSSSKELPWCPQDKNLPQSYNPTLQLSLNSSELQKADLCLPS